MPPRKKLTMSDEVKGIIMDDAKALVRRWKRADIEAKIQIYKSLREGVAAEDLAAHLKIAPSTVYEWAKVGEQHFLHPPEREEEQR